MGEVSGESALANAGVTGDEAYARGGAVVEPFRDLLREPRAALKGLGEQVRLARVVHEHRELPGDLGDVACKLDALPALDHADELRHAALEPRIEDLGACSELLAPERHIEPLDMHEHRRRAHLALRVEKHGLDVAATNPHGDVDLIVADAAIAERVLGEARDDAVGG